MWEHGEETGALLIWAEHRFYGKSVPVACSLDLLTSKQAMADFVKVIDVVQSTYSSTHLPVVGFGGSYGGMLAAWMRMKYPSKVQGSIAASAPIWAFTGLTPAYDPAEFARVISRSAPCGKHVKQALKHLVHDASNAALTSAFHTCQSVKHMEHREYLRAWASDHWGSLAMGNFPFESSYLTNGRGLLPAWPVKAACAHFARTEDFLEGLFLAGRVFNNVSGSMGACLDLEARPVDVFRLLKKKEKCRKGSWGYQWCTDFHMPFTQGECCSVDNSSLISQTFILASNPF